MEDQTIFVLQSNDDYEGDAEVIGVFDTQAKAIAAAQAIESVHYPPGTIKPTADDKEVWSGSEPQFRRYAIRPFKIQ